ncbi:MAG: sigma-70 family RNA polymerase sigma factor [bacterium]|nr:sigma-70 family RNA polymerase sigma factor [bacterium]
MNVPEFVVSNLLKRKMTQDRLMRKGKAEVDPDFDLVEKSRAGDDAAFEELLRRHYPGTYALVFRLTNAAHADDVTQETFLLAYRNLSRFRGEAKFSTWLTRIAVNLCRSEWRKRKRRREESVEDVPEKLVADMSPGKSKNGAEAMMDGERGERIDREIAALPSKLRLTFTLRYLEGHPPAEVAAILGCREGTVRSRLFNAREILKVRLKDLVT